MAKGKRSEPQQATSAEAALKKLEQHGERFLAMFDDEDTKKPRKASSSGRQASTGGRPAPSALTSQLAAARKPAGAPIAGTAGEQPTAKAQRGKQLGSEQGRSQSTGTTGPSTSSPGVSTGRQGKRGSVSAGDEIDAIMRAGKKAKQGKSSTPGLANQKGDTGQAAAEAAQKAAAAAEALRRERKLFMSHKASKVHEAVTMEPTPSRRGSVGTQGDDDESGLTPEAFRKLHMEVEKFAASALDKKGAKQYKARMLERIGAKAEKAPRTALSIGKGMATMSAKRQARALEEAIETGMVQRKGLGKKKRALKAKNRDRGLMEAGPSFKNGILRVKPMKKTRAESGKLRLPKGVL